MTKPLDIGFNVAVRHIASRLFPCGFDTTPDATLAPSTLDGLKAHIAATGRMLVWSGASDATIFACPETNHAFRAWHDWCHWRFSLPFDLAGERAAAAVQKGHLATIYGRSHPDLARWQRLVDIEVTGQVEHYEATGEFVEDQMAFALARLAA